MRVKSLHHQSRLQRSSLAHPERRTVAYPEILFMGTDGLDLMGPDLARNVLKKAFLLEIEAVELPSEKVREAYGQVGFVGRPDQNGMITGVRSITSLHNIVLEKEKYEFISGRTKFQGGGYVLRFTDCKRAKDDIAPYPLRQGSEASPRNDNWESGIDAAVVSVPSVITAEQCFKIGP
jgi:hypothetical protein